MNRKNILFVIIVPFIIIIVLYFFQNVQSEKTEHNIAKPVVEKIWTRIDSIVYDYDSIVSRQVDSAGTVGAALAVVHKGEILLLRCFGVREAGTGKPVDPATVFRLASVSKTITGTLAAVLSKNNTIPLESRIIDYLPGFLLKDSINTYELTVEHILSHTSGLVPHAYDNLVEAGVDFRIIMDSLHRVNISAPPGRLYGYQNVIFSLYDTISAPATGKNFENLMQDMLFTPLAMEDASVGKEAFEKNKNKALPHSSGGRKYRYSKDNQGYFLTNPAAGVNASITDMAKYMNAILGHKPEVLDTSTINTVLNPRVLSPLRWHYLRKWKNVESKQYALGWRIIGAYGSVFAYHGGYIRGYRSEIVICPDEDFGIAFLSNSPNGVDSGIIPLFLDMYFGE